MCNTATNIRQYVNSLTGIWQKLVCAISCLSILFPCLSNANPLGDTFSWNAGEYQRDIRMDILPTSMMDDETLFYAAEQVRSGKMCTAQRLINNRWLIESEQNTYSGDEALNKVLKMTLLKLWHLKTRSGITPSNLDNEEPLSLTTFDNYHLRLSGGGVKLSLKLRFN